MSFFGLLKCNCINNWQKHLSLSTLMFQNCTKLLWIRRYARSSCCASHILFSNMQFDQNCRFIVANVQAYNCITSKTKYICKTSTRCYSKQDSEWENLLLSDKRNNIKDIPVKVRVVAELVGLICSIKLLLFSTVLQYKFLETVDMLLVQLICFMR